MAALGITVLKNNAPWGPFTREQIDGGLARGDFSLKFLAHAPGLHDWLPLGEVLDYVERNSGPRSPSLPPLPGPRELPPIPETEETKPPVSVFSPERPSRPPILPASVESALSPPPPLPPVVEKEEIEPARQPGADLRPASFFMRSIAVGIDVAILFIPVGALFIIGALAIEIPAVIHPISHQSRMEEWDLLELNVGRLSWLVAVGFGWLYGAGMESSKSQATLGKRWAGIKITDMHGERISFLRGTGRYAAKYLSALPCFLGFIMALFSSRNLALHDRLSGTRAVRS